jgi:tetratricopeptide (TPR) repeat protein/transcriptional regulator with XRE-family HTH domain
MTAFSDLLRRARLSAGLSQQELGERSGVSVRQISYLESGRTRRPYRRTVQLLADALSLGASARAELENAARVSMRMLALEDDKSTAAAAATIPVPAQLPHDIPGFTGRAAELATLTKLREQSTGVLLISAIDGTAGIGKTALAIHWAHQMAGFFPDGQLYVNLRGFGPGESVVPAEAIGEFLDTLAVLPERKPVSLDARAALYRSLLAGRRMLIVLDNAYDEEQVRPLLPGNRECMVIVTSRRRMGGLIAADGASVITLEPMTYTESRDLLALRLDEVQIMAEAQAVSALIKFCAGLPLALAVTAAYAAARPDLSLTGLAAGLHGEAGRLDMLDVGDVSTSVRAAFSWTYRYLDPASARLFRLLALHPGPDITVAVAASLANTSLANARELLGKLTRVSLLRQHDSRRFAFHDLVRIYARELVDNDDEEDRAAALSGLFDYYLHSAAVAMDIMFPAETGRRPRVASRSAFTVQFNSRQTALAWLDAERANLTAVVHAGIRDWPDHVTRLAGTLFRYLDAGGHVPEAIAIQGDASRSAADSGDQAAEAVALTNLSVVCIRQGKGDEAISYLQQALRLYPATGDRNTHARALHNLGVVYGRRDQYEQAVDYTQQALDLHREMGDHVGQARSLNSLGHIEVRRGHPGRAALLQQQALALSREAGDRNGEAYALAYLGALERHRGHDDAAESYIQQALIIFREIRDRYGEAGTLVELGVVELRQGRCTQSLSHFRQALDLFRKFGDPSGEAEALNGLGEALLAVGQPAMALEQHRAALSLAREAGTKEEEARAHKGLSRACQAAGNNGG